MSHDQPSSQDQPLSHDETFGHWLRRRRRALDLTQGALAHCAGCSVITIRKFEADERRPSRQLAELLAGCLRIPADEREAFVAFARRPEWGSAGASEPASITSYPVLPRFPSPQPPLEGRGSSLSGSPAPSLPTPLTTFIGRDATLDDLMRFVRDGRARPLTLTGAGGSGKTRLALEVAIDAAAELADVLPDGVYWVDLAPLEDATRIAATIAHALGLLEAVEQPAEARLAAYLASRRVLIVLDNCEHLIDAAARLVERLLRHCPDAQLLATSREALGVPGEHVYPVPTLSLPTATAAPEVMLSSEAVRLFVERAAAQRPGFHLATDNAADIAQICRRLDGIPLALELAAARIKVLSPAQIAARLDDRFALLTGGARTALPRQQTLRALVDWSYDLLEPAERVLFRRLAVFAGSWTLEAAEEVTSDERRATSDERRAPNDPTPVGQRPTTSDDSPRPLRREHIVDLLSRLVDKSLVKTVDANGDLRYEMLETMRAYARERLLAAGEMPDLRWRHLAYMVAWAERVAPALCGPQQAAWLNRVEREHDNLRLALRRALVDGGGAHPLAGARLAGALGQFWLRRNYPQEGAHWTRCALALLPDDAPPAVAAPLFSAAGSMAWLGSDIEQAAAHHERARQLFLEAGDSGQAALALRNVAVQEQWLGRVERATELSAEAAAQASDSGNRWAYGCCLLNLGLCYYYSPSRHEATSPTLEESVDVLREVGDGWPMAIGLCALGMQAARVGETEWAAAYMAEALQIVTELGDPRLEALTWQSWGKVQRIRGQPAGAADSYRRGLRLFARTADRANTVETLEELAVVLSQTGTELDLAARLLGAAEVWREQLQVVTEDDLPDMLAETRPALRAALGEAAFDRAFARGGALMLEEAVALAVR